MTEIDFLQKLESLLKEMEFEASLLGEQNGDFPQESMVVLLEPDHAARERQLYISFFPDDEEFEGSRLIQFYTQIPTTLTTENRQSLLWFLPLMNNRCAIGHFGLTNEMDAIQFRYVYTWQKKLEPAWGHLKDILDLMIYTPDMFTEFFQGLEAGKNFDELMAILAKQA